MTALSTATGTMADRILDVAEALAQTRGFSAFSYADIAAEVGITRASLHYHFPTKAELGRALVARYSARFAEALDVIDASSTTTVEKVNRYVDLFEAVLVRQRLCLCGMLAAEYLVLPEPMRREVRGFFDANQVWLDRVLQAGIEGRSVRTEGSAAELAGSLIAALEGAMLLAYAYGDPERFRTSVRRLLVGLGLGG